MSERVAKLLEHENIELPDNIINHSGYGTLPSTCPSCEGPLDFGKIGEDELICRKKCGYRFTREDVE